MRNIIPNLHSVETHDFCALYLHNPAVLSSKNSVYGREVLEAMQALPSIETFPKDSIQVNSIEYDDEGAIAIALDVVVRNPSVDNGAPVGVIVGQVPYRPFTSANGGRQRAYVRNLRANSRYDDLVFIGISGAAKDDTPRHHIQAMNVHAVMDGVVKALGTKGRNITKYKRDAFTDYAYIDGLFDA